MSLTLKSYSILYVEDEPKIQANIAEYLGEHFAKVYLADDGEKALEQYGKHQPDVLLLDINLPKKDGLEVAEEVRLKDKAIKIIMLTAFTEKDKLLKATELKLTKYLVKPVTPKAFKDTLLLLAQELTVGSSLFLNLGGACVWNQEQEKLSVNGKTINLAEKAHRLLKLFIRNKGQTVSYEKIMTAVWDDSHEKEISLDSVKNQVSKLRKKIPSDCLSSVYGEGYILK